MLITVSVNDQWVLLPIGWYPEEIQVKTELLVSATIIYECKKFEDDLSNTIDYQLISEQILNLKNTKFKLIESAAEFLLNNLYKSLSDNVDIQKIAILFKKINIANVSTSCQNHSILIEKAYK